MASCTVLKIGEFHSDIPQFYLSCDMFGPITCEQKYVIDNDGWYLPHHNVLVYTKLVGKKTLKKLTEKTEESLSQVN